MVEFDSLLSNKNLNFVESKEGLYIEFVPYNNELEDIDYIKKWLENIMYCELDILDYFDVDYFAINLGSYNLEGLTETSNTLVFDRSVLYYSYGNEYRIIEL